MDKFWDKIKERYKHYKMPSGCDNLNWINALWGSRNPTALRMKFTEGEGPGLVDVEFSLDLNGWEGELENSELWCSQIGFHACMSMAFPHIKFFQWLSGGCMGFPFIGSGSQRCSLPSFSRKLTSAPSFTGSSVWLPVHSPYTSLTAKCCSCFTDRYSMRLYTLPPRAETSFLVLADMRYITEPCLLTLMKWLECTTT